MTFANLLTDEVRENVMRTREQAERFNKARAVGRAKIHMRNARDLMLAGYTAQADNELDAAEAALAKEWGA